MRNMVKAISCLSLSVIVGCGSTQTLVEKPHAVVVEKEKIIPIATDLFSPCSGKPPAMPVQATNGDLLWSWVGWKSYAECLELKLKNIRELNEKVK